MVQQLMQHSFSQVPAAEIQRSSFDRFAQYSSTFNAGLLIPFYCEEILPGDTFATSCTLFARINTLINPIFSGLYMDTHFFYVPNRLVWDNWQKMNGEQANPGDSTSYLTPQIVSPVGGFPTQQIFDYLGVPMGIAGYSMSALPLRAYNLIWNEWFRDENLCASVSVPTGDGPDASTLYTLRRRGKRHDYFTSCLPWPQKGTAVTLPLGTTAPVIPNMTNPGTSNVPYFGNGTDNLSLRSISGNQQVQYSTAATVTANNMRWGSPTGLVADLTSASAATINSLRLAFQVQRLFERDARGGTRYTEILRAHFGVISPDARLQRPEYLGGGSTPLNTVPVTQTSATPSEPSPLASLGAYGTFRGHNHGFTKSFVEHGYVIGLVSVRSDLVYQQGLDRMWSRSGRFDYYWPALAHLGEQAVLNKEIMLQGTSADNQVFGYNERWAEYRYKRSMVTSQFRSSFPQTLDSWHLAQSFSSLPTLNQSFIEDNPPIDRVVAVPTAPDILFDCAIRERATRPMPMYSVPGLIDHF